MSEQDVIALHSAHDYLIDMLGFLPASPTWAASTRACTRRAWPSRARKSPQGA